MEEVDLSHLKNKKMALVLSGGIVKAASWHIGVALALEELGLCFKNNDSPEDSDLEVSTFVGSSAGSLIGLYLASGYGPSEVIEATRKKNNKTLNPITYKDMLGLEWPMKKSKRPMDFYGSLEGLPLFIRKILSPITGISGFFTTEGLKKYVLKNCIKEKTSFHDYKADLFVIATKLDQSNKAIFGKYTYPASGHGSHTTYYDNIPVAEGIAASMSVPPFYCPYPIKDPITGQTDYYIDGEIRETLSTHVAVDNNCDVIISSWTHTPYHYHDEIGSLVNYGLPAICTQAIYLMVQKKILTARFQRENAKDVIDTVHRYMKEEKFSTKHRERIVSILERKLNFDPKIKLVDIYPNHNDYRSFFKNPFSLNREGTAMLITAGHDRTMEVLRAYDWS